MGGRPAAEVTQVLGEYRLTVATRYGPRLLGLEREDSPDMLVRLGSGAAIESGNSTFRFRGGHRLWAAPEQPHLTYVPDDDPVDISSEADALRVVGPVDAAGFQKVLEIRTEGTGVAVEHRLYWQGDGTITAAAWAITQVPLGGTAILPIGGPAEDGLQADRSLVLWPYTDLSDPRLRPHQSALLIEGRPGGRLKVGSGPTPGRLGYLRDGWLFTKTVEPAGDGEYADRGAVAQVFTGGEYLELETLGPLTELVPGAAAGHREVWHVNRCPDREVALEAVVGA